MLFTFLIFVSVLTALLADPMVFWYVNPSTTCGQSCDGSVNNPFKTIQEGLDAVENDNTTVVLMDGIYNGTGNVNLEITLNRRTISSQNGKSTTIIDCENENTFLHLSQARLYLQGVTVENCIGSSQDSNDSTTYGGALYVYDTYAVIVDSDFSLNSADFGGTAYVDTATIQFEGTNFANGEASYGGAIYAVNAIVIAVDGSKVINNKATTGGGGIHMVNTSLRFEDTSYLKFNQATNYNGNEISCERSQGDFLSGSYIVSSTPGADNFEDRIDTVCENACELGTPGSTDWCDVNQNITEYVYVDPTASCTLACDGREHFPYLTIQEALNVADSLTVIILYDGTYTGLGNVNLEVFDSFGRIRALNSYSSDNVIIDCQNNAFGFAFVKGTYELTGLTIKNCVGVERNISTLSLGNGTAQASNTQDSIGGGLWLELANIDVNNCSFEDNTADIGAGFYSYFSTVYIGGSTFQGNTANNDGAGIFVWSGYMVIDDSSQIIENSAGVAGGGIYIKSATVELDGGSIIYDNAAWGNGNEVYCESGAGNLLNDASVGNVDLTGFEAGDAVCEESCTLTRINDNFDYCNYDPPTQDSDESSNDESQEPVTTLNGTNPFSASIRTNNVSIVAVLLGALIALFVYF